jgi:hypothetical protein
LLTIGALLDGVHPGKHTAPALSIFEPHVKWERKFLELRKACYQITHNARFEQASDDLDEFLKNEPLTADISLLGELLRGRSPDAASEINHMRLSRLSQR